jgi:uncharacterized phage-associated protein
MPYEAKAVANYFLDLAEGSGSSLNPMKIQKLVYFAHGWNLAVHDAPLIDESVEAWPYGPVIPTLYHEFKKFGRGPITAKARNLQNIIGTKLLWVTPGVGDEETMDLLATVWEGYGSYSAVQLSNMTHEPGTSWHQVYHQNTGQKGINIPDAIIKAYFVGQPF